MIDRAVADLRDRDIMAAAQEIPAGGMGSGIITVVTATPMGDRTGTAVAPGAIPQERAHLAAAVLGVADSAVQGTAIPVAERGENS